MIIQGEIARCVVFQNMWGFVCSPVSNSQILQEAVKMKKELKIILSAMASVILVAVVCAVPITLPNNTATHEQTALETQSGSGKIALVQKPSFTLNIGPGHTISNPAPQVKHSSHTT